MDKEKLKLSKSQSKRVDKDSERKDPSQSTTRRGRKRKLDDCSGKDGELVKSSIGKKTKLTPSNSPVGGEKCEKLNLVEQKCKSDFDKGGSVSDAKRLAIEVGVSEQVASNIIQLLDEDCTIPFIARYRQNLIGALDPDKLRQVKNSYEKVKEFNTRSMKLLKKVKDECIIEKIKQMTAIDELEIIEECFKEKKKSSKIPPDKEKFLESAVSGILHGTDNCCNLLKFVDSKIEELKDVKSVKTYIQRSIVDLIKKDEDLPELLTKIKSANYITMESNLKKDAKDEYKKYEVYYEFSKPVKKLLSYQVLAINRGEDQGVLSVKIVIPNDLWQLVRNHYTKKWLNKGVSFPMRNEMFDEGFKGFITSAKSTLTRQIRRKLTTDAVEEALSTFTSNLRQLLLTQPLRGKVVLAIDPGFKAGCKVAVVDDKGKPLHFTKFFLNQETEASLELKKLLERYNCDTIAIGNGSGGRETGIFVSSLIKSNFFAPREVKFKMVDEQGVSIYSCSPVAKEEFPDLNPLNISAVSLARRLQDPISELVKVDPKNLGVGLYQHDLPQKKLETALTEVTVECVSFVGVDVNTASIHLLRRVAGLSSAKVTSLKEWLTENCHFRVREDFRKVKGIGEKTFKQCAGFLRILPSTARCSHERCQKTQLNPLDQTWIHPEFYDTTYRLLKTLKLELDFGNTVFIEKFKERMKEHSPENLSEAMNVPRETIQLIIDALTRLPDWDYRTLSEPIPRETELLSVNNLKVCDKIQGIVRNVVAFGAFVDIGVEFNGLIHKSRQRNHNLKVNDKVTVRVLKIDIERKRIELQMEEFS